MARRWGATLAAVVLALAVVSGCGGSTGEVQRAEEICAELESSIGGQPGVVGVDVSFLHTPVNPGDAGVQIQTSGGADTAALTELATRLVWTSDLQPLKRITVAVDGATPPTTYELPKQSSELETRFGLRPHVEEEVDTGDAALVLAAVAGVGLVLVLIVLGVVILLWRRHRKRAA